MKSSDNWSEFYNNNFNNNNYYPENFVQRIFTSTKPVKFLDQNFENKRILDLGCGYGRNIPFLINLGFKVNGIEISPALVKNLKIKFPEQNFKKGVSSDIPYKNNYFDYVLACNSIYYVDDIKGGVSKNFDEVKRVLKNNGKFIFSLIGAGHSIFNNSEKISNHYYVLKDDFLHFRNGLTVFGIKGKNDINEYLDDFKYLNHGEINEKVQNYKRQLFYFLYVNK